MQRLSLLFNTTVGKKFLLALTGVLLSLFVLGHMSGNLLLFVGPQAYNSYSHGLITNPFLYGVETVLAACFLIHILLAVQLTLKNRTSRGMAPHRPAHCSKAARFGSQSMILTGLVLLVFTILHLITFKYGPHYSTHYGGVEMRDLYRLVHEKFHEPLYLGGYVFALILLGIHLSHGLSALFQSLGFMGVKNQAIKKLGWTLCAIISVGFILPPVFFFFGMGGAR